MKRFTIVSVFFSLFLLVSCGANSEKKDLENYINVELPKIVDTENTVTQGYDAVSGTNYKDDLTMYNALKDNILPASLKLTDEAEKITPSTKKLREIHEKYLSAINTQHQAFTEILSALSSKDVSKVTSANELLSKARKDMRDYMSELKEYAEKNNIKINTTS